MTAIDALLILPILVLIFSAYEIGAIQTKKWHTISYYAKRNLLVETLLIFIIFLAFVSLIAWFVWHLTQWIPQ